MIYSDHQSLIHFKNQRKLKNKMHIRWAAYFRQFNYVIKHKSRATNRVADALSERDALLVNLCNKMVVGFEFLQELYEGDEYCFARVSR